MSAVSPWSQDRFLEALTFAAQQHGDQKTPMGLPYVVHLASVAQEVTAALAAAPGRNGDLAVTAALLHDVIEDTAGTARMVGERFGADVAAAVVALTKNPDLPKDRRMPDSLARIQAQPAEVWMVKLADRIVNLAPPPAHWTRDKAAAYRAEAQTILDALGAASPFLACRLGQRIAAYAKYTD